MVQGMMRLKVSIGDIPEVTLDVDDPTSDSWSGTVVGSRGRCKGCVDLEVTDGELKGWVAKAEIVSAGEVNPTRLEGKTQFAPREQ